MLLAAPHLYGQRAGRFDEVGVAGVQYAHFQPLLGGVVPGAGEPAAQARAQPALDDRRRGLVGLADARFGGCQMQVALQRLLHGPGGGGGRAGIGRRGGLSGRGGEDERSGEHRRAGQHGESHGNLSRGADET